MPPVGFEPTILVSERPQIHALDRAATGIGTGCPYLSLFVVSADSVGEPSGILDFIKQDSICL